jgi:hypothetical protein
MLFKDILIGIIIVCSSNLPQFAGRLVGSNASVPTKVGPAPHHVIPPLTKASPKLQKHPKHAVKLPKLMLQIVLYQIVLITTIVMRLIAAQSEEDVIKMKLGSQAPD